MHPNAEINFRTAECDKVFELLTMLAGAYLLTLTVTGGNSLSFCRLFQDSKMFQMQWTSFQSEMLITQGLS